MVVDGSDKAVAKELARIAAMRRECLNVVRGFLQIKGFEVKTGGDTLVESFAEGEAELVSQARLLTPSSLAWDVTTSGSWFIPFSSRF